MNRIPCSALAVALFLAAPTALGATRYVTDELRINVRTGQGNEYRIIELIDSGTRLEVLTTEGEWAEVKTPGGNTGWVQAQYLDEQPIAEDRLRSALSELGQARERIATLEEELAQAQGNTVSAREEIDQLNGRIEQLETRLDNADEGLALHDENQRLAEQLEALEDRVSEARAQARLAEQRSRKEWFLIGGGVVFGGILFGIVVTRIPWRRRRDRMF